MQSELVKPDHLKRRAVVYIRQSTTHQVVNNQESLRLQYALRQLGHELGWHEADIDVIVVLPHAQVSLVYIMSKTRTRELG